MIEIRRAELADVEAVRRIGVVTWPVAYEGIGSAEFVTEGLAAWWSPEAVERGIRSGITLLAEVDGSAVGMVGLGQEDGFWVMWKLYVLPDWQGRGVRKALIDRAIAELPEGTDELLLDVLVANEKAIAFYRSQGFGTPAATPARDLGPELIWMSRRLGGP